MSDAEKPDNPPTPAPEAQPEPAPQSPRGHDAGRGPGRPGARMRRETRAGATAPNLPVPSVEREHYYGGRPSLRDLDKDIEGELEAALAGMSDADLYGAEKQRAAPPGPGDGPKKMMAKVLSVRGPDVFVDVPGSRSQGVLPLLQFPDGPPAPGTEVEVTFEGYDGANGLLVLARKGAAVAIEDWSDLVTGMTVEARVTGTNKGGLSVEVNGKRGFLPISQIELFRVENIEQYVNQKLLVKVTEVNREERNLVVSRRELLEAEREEQREKFWQEVAEGQIREGLVRSVRDFGAFVDLGGADGLLHVGEMAWQRVKDPNTIVQPGQRVKVVVLRVDREKRKLSLGMKQLMASPWEDIESRYPHSTIVKGTVTKTMEFGAFVELEPGIEGLIHISELSPQRVRRVTDFVKPGQEVQVMILSVDKNARKLSLSLKAALPKPEAPPEEEEVEEEPVEVKPPKPRTTPLRGGIGDGGPLFG